MLIASLSLPVVAVSALVGFSLLDEIAGNENLLFRQCIRTAFSGDAALYAFPNDLANLLYDVIDVRPYNLDHRHTPAAVVYPRSSQEASGAVLCAEQFDIKVQARSGGHSYLSHCLGGADGALVIDLKHLDGFSYNPAAGTTTFGPGNLLGPLTDKLDSLGRTMAYGVNANVGAGGHITIGGLGTMSRQLGLALDQILSVECALANGTMVTASDSVNSDLFWAIRGAGASFAIVTSFTARTVPAPQVIDFTINITAGRISDLAGTWKAWQEFVAQPDLTRLFGCTLTLTGLGVGGILILHGTYYGSQAELDQLNLLAILPQASTELSITSSFLTTTANSLLQLSMDLVGGIPTHFYAKSLKYTNQNLLSLTQTQSMFEYLERAPKGHPSLVHNPGPLRRRHIRPSTDRYSILASRCDFLSSELCCGSFGFGGGRVNDLSREFLNGFNAMVMEMRGGGEESAYAGYVDDELKDLEEAYWGGNVRRLREVKRRVDPRERFWNPQSVRPA